MRTDPPSSQPETAARRVNLSVVVPVYNCAATLNPLHQRLTQVLKPLVAAYEIVFVDDRSDDNSWQVMRRLASEDANIVACRLAHNVGQHLAITAGLENAAGERVVVIDGDLQDPPETIPDLLAAANDGDGADIVFARRIPSRHQTGSDFGTWLRARLLEALSGHAIQSELGAFSLISRRAVNAFLKFRERDRHYLILLHELGFDTKTVDYVRDTRLVGPPSASAPQALGRALTAAAFATPRLLYGVIHIGLALAGLGVLTAIGLVGFVMLDGGAPAWAPTVAAIFFTGGVVTLCLGVIGLYLGRLFDASRERPLYFVQDRIDAQAQVRRKLDLPAPVSKRR